MYLGTGSDVRIDFGGTTVLPNPPAGKGWIQVLLERSALNEFFVANPESEGRPAPTNEQVLTWNAGLGVAEWQDAGTGFAYTTNNAAVAAATGATTSAKISAAIGNPSYIGQNATCIVAGDPGTTYEGLYIWGGTQWNFAAHFAFNTASQVPAVNPMTSASGSTQGVLNALKVVDDGLQSQVTTNTGNIATLQGQMATAQTDINNLEIGKLDKASNVPTAGQILSFDGTGQLWVDDAQGDVTGVNATFPITVDNTDPQQPTIGINGASTVAPGAVQLNDTVNSTSTLQAATANAVKTTYDLASAAVPRASYTAQGDMLVGTGAGTFGALGVGTQGQILAVGPGGSVQWEDDAPGDVSGVTGTAPITVDNTDPENPIVGVDLATTATPGVVQVELTGNLTLVAGVIDVPDASTTVKGAVQLNNTLGSGSTTEALTAAQGAVLQGQIDALTLSNSVILAGGYDADTGLVDGVTSQGTLAGFVDGSAPPTAASGNVDHYLICIVAGNIPSAMQNGDWLLSVETAPGVYNYQVLGVGARPASASYTQAGIVQLADAAAVLAGTSDTLAITPQALQDNIIDSVTTVNSSQMASATAVNTAYVAATTAQTAANNAQATADAALPKAGGTMTGTLTGQNVNVQNTYSLQFAGGTNGSLNAVTDLTNVTSSTTAASATAVKAAADAAGAAQTTASAALPKAGGTMTGNITFQDAGEGVVFNGGSQVFAISDSTSTTSSTTAASATAVKAAYDAGVQGQTDAAAAQSDADQALLDAAAAQSTADQAVLDAAAAQATADAAIPDATFTTAGQLLYGTGAGTYDVLPIGTNGQSLIVSSGAIAWGASLQGYTNIATPFNTALGGNAGDSILTGTNNTNVGYNAGTALTSGGGNTFVGSGAGDSAITADNSVGVGFNALTGAATANGTVAIGSGALASLTSGAGNVGIGYQVLDTLITGANNTAVGFQAGTNVATSVSGNTLIGYQAGNGTTTGGQNTFVGNGAGSSVTTGANNTILGNYNGIAALSGNVVLATGAGNIRFQSNSSGAWSPDGTNYGTAGQVLTSQGSGAAPVWSDNGSGTVTSITAGSGLTGGTITTSGTIALDPNAVIAPTLLTTTGDIIYASAANTPARLGIGTTGQVLTVAGGVPTWAAPAASLSGITLSSTPFTTALGSNAGGALTANSVANTAIGYNALDSETSGDFNTAIGHNALTAQNGASHNTVVGGNAGAQLTTGSDNTFVGSGAGDITTVSSGSVAIGKDALGAAYNQTGAVAIGLNSMLAATTAARTTAVGYASLDALTTGSNNTALGYNSLGANVTGTDNTAVGNDALAVATGSFNVAVGSIAQDLNTTGSNNVSIGYSAHGSATLPQEQVAVGRSALQSNSSTGAVGVGHRAALNSTALVTAIGWQSLQSLTTGTANTAVGYNTGAVYTGSRSVFIGHSAGDIATTGNSNVIIGADAGGAMTTGQQNIFIGDTAGDAITTGSSNTIIGDVAGTAALANNLILAAGTDIKLQVNENGAVGVGTTPDYGTAGQVLTSGGTGAAPTWTTVSGGGLTGITSAVTTALGNNALDSITDPGVLNTAVGIDAGTAITTGDQNTLVGYQAGQALTVNSANVLMGHQAGVSLTGEGNVGIGSAAGPIGGATNSTFVGAGAGNIASGNSNVGIGSGSAAKATGNFNTAVGASAGSEISSGASNTFVGNGAGRTITTGSNNTIIGRYTGGGDPALSNNVIISAGASDIKLVINNTDAVSFGGLTNFGTAGQILMSNGTGAAPTWNSSAALLPNYGSFLSTIPQNNVDTTNGNAATFNTTTESRNVSVVDGTKLTVASAGTYNIQFSAQVTKTDAGSDDINIWFKKNGVNVANSTSNVTLVGNNTPQLATVNFVLTLAANDYIEIWWWSLDTDVQLLAEPAAAPYPAIPSIIATVVPVGA
jgi:hypothetical protein